MENRQGLILQLIFTWEPPDRQCGNCLLAVVFGEADDPMVRCLAGKGEPRSLVRVCRPRHPYVFASAKNCPDFEAAG